MKIIRRDHPQQTRISRSQLTSLKCDVTMKTVKEDSSFFSQELDERQRRQSTIISHAVASHLTYYYYKKYDLNEGLLTEDDDDDDILSFLLTHSIHALSRVSILLIDA